MNVVLCFMPHLKVGLSEWFGKLSAWAGYLMKKLTINDGLSFAGSSLCAVCIRLDGRRGHTQVGMNRS
jgi:hypothetical protein